jgi:hypothetical protein
MIRVLTDTIYPILLTEKMMNSSDLHSFTFLLRTSDLKDRNRVWMHLIRMFRIFKDGDPVY